MRKVEDLIDKVLISEEEISEGIDKAAEWVNSNYADKTPVLLGILKGCIPFYGALIPKLDIRCEFEFMAISSFKGQTSASSEPIITLDITLDIKDREVLIIEDIIDTARSLKKIVEYLYSRGAKNVKIITLLDKKEGRKVELDAEYSCFEIPNVFIVGFGLDYQEELRNLPFIGILKKEIYTKE